MNVSAKTKLCIIIGDPVEHSLSPTMHNAAYQALGIDDQFVFTAAHVKVEGVKTVVEAVRVMGIRGLTCTIPHKIEVVQYLDEVDEIARQIGAVNTVVNESGKLIGYNTDWLGVITPLEEILSQRKDTLENKKAAVIGAGGAARAVVYGLKKKGVAVTIFNRTLAKAQELATEIGCKAQSIDDMKSLNEYDILFNATNVGMEPHQDKSPISKELIQKHHIVFDAIYVPFETQLLQDAKAKGATIIHGLEMLLHQGTAQFELYTNHKAPVEVMRKVIYERFAS
jgi:shikimate dehydrogenase